MNQESLLHGLGLGPPRRGLENTPGGVPRGRLPEAGPWGPPSLRTVPASRNGCHAQITVASRAPALLCSLLSFHLKTLSCLPPQLSRRTVMRRTPQQDAAARPHQQNMSRALNSSSHQAPSARFRNSNPHAQTPPHRLLGRRAPGAHDTDTHTAAPQTRKGPTGPHNPNCPPRQKTSAGHSIPLGRAVLKQLGPDLQGRRRALGTTF